MKHTRHADAIPGRMLAAVAFIMALAAPAPARAEDAASRASTAVANVLFDYDGDEFASYVVRDDGFVDITFASNTPDALYSKLLEKLRTSPDIKGVLAGRGGPTCSRF